MSNAFAITSICVWFPSVCVCLLCLCVCVLACKCNYNGPGHICVAYFEAYFLAGKRQLQQPLSLPLCVCAHGIKLQMMLCLGQGRRKGRGEGGALFSGEATLGCRLSEVACFVACQRK